MAKLRVPKVSRSMPHRRKITPRSGPRCFGPDIPTAGDGGADRGARFSFCRGSKPPSPERVTSGRTLPLATDRERSAKEKEGNKPHHLPQDSTKYCVNRKSNSCSFFFLPLFFVLLFLRVNCSNPAQQVLQLSYFALPLIFFFRCLPCRQAHTGNKLPQPPSSPSQTFAAGQLITCRTGNATSEGNFN